MDDRLQVGLDRGVAHRKHIGHRHHPTRIDLGAQAQALPRDAPGARHLASDALHQQLVRITSCAVALQCLCQRQNAGVADPQRLVTRSAAHPFQQARGEQLDLDRVLARPAGRAVHLAQAALVGGGDRQSGHGRQG